MVPRRALLRPCRYLNRRTIPDFVRRPADNHIARFQIPEHFHEISFGYALLDIDPLRLTVLILTNVRSVVVTTLVFGANTEGRARRTGHFTVGYMPGANEPSRFITSSSMAMVRVF